MPTSEKGPRGIYDLCPVQKLGGRAWVRGKGTHRFILHFPEERSGSRPVSLEKPLEVKMTAISTLERKREESNRKERRGQRRNGKESCEIMANTQPR